MSEFVSGVDPASFPEPFAELYRSHLQHLQLKGLRPKTVEAYARAMRRIGEHFDFEVTALSPAQLTDYFTAMKASHSWSGVKLDLSPRRAAPSGLGSPRGTVEATASA